MALVGDARRQHSTWALLFAVGPELGMLLTPYPRFFGIAPGPSFVAFAVAAHLVFGAAMRSSALGLSRVLTPSAHR